MKGNIFKLGLIIFLILIASYFWYVKSSEPSETNEAIQKPLWNDYEIQTRTIDGKRLRLVVADTPEKWQKGLMYVRKPVKDFDGMIFIFPEKQMQSFWNQNTFEDLTLYWMNDDTVVGKSELPSIEKSKKTITVSSQEPVNIVVEVIE